MPDSNSSSLEGEFELSPEEPSVSTRSSSERDVPLEPSIRDQGNVHFFSSLCQYPKGVRFATQDHDEDIILLIRRSFFVNIPWIISAILLSLVPPVIGIFFPSLFDVFSLSSVTFLLYTLFFYLGIFGFILLNFALWYFHVGLVTNKRVVDVDLNGLLIRHIAETRLSLIQDVSYQQVGFLRSLLGFGDVFVQTAGSAQNVEFDRVPQPETIARIIGDMIGRKKH